MHQEQMKRSGGASFQVKQLVKYDSKGQLYAVEMSKEEKLKFEEDQRKFALEQATKEKDVANLDLKEFRKKERFINPITRVAGQETSSEKMRLMWISLQKMLQQDEQIKNRMTILKNNLTVDNMNEVIKELEQIIQNSEDNLSSS